MRYTVARLLSWLERHPVAQGGKFYPWAGHTGRLRVRCPAGVHMGSNQSMLLFLSLLPPFLCLKSIKTHPQVRMNKMWHTTGFQVRSTASVFTHEQVPKKVHFQKLKCNPIL